MGIRFGFAAKIGHFFAFFSILSGVVAPTASGAPIFLDQNRGAFRSCDLSVGTLPQGAQIHPNALKEINSADTLVTPMWAQEAIGGPESLQFMIDIHSRNPQKPLLWVPIGISDGNFRLRQLPIEKLNQELRLKRAEIEYSEAVVKDQMGNKDAGEHTYAVATLISETQGFGTGYFSYLSWFSDGVNVTRKKQRTSAIQAAEVLPQFVNRSVESADPTQMDDSPEVSEVSQRSIMVVAAGNKFPWPTDKGAYRSIVVGGVTSQGIMARFSRHGSAVDIAAPGFQVLAFTKPKELGLVSGTSFAAPLVTGALSSVGSLLPGISFDELKHLLRMTAIKTSAYTRTSTGDGAGVINQYALVRIAERLREYWPKNRDQIYKAWPYDFQSEIANRKKTIQSLSENFAAEPCARKKGILLSLRQNFFLNPSDKETRSSLAALYATNGYYQQAFYYEDPERNLSISPNLATILDQREFQVEVGNGNLQRLKALTQVSLSTAEERGTILQIAAERGHTSVLRFLIEDWGHLQITKSLRDQMLLLALLNKHQETAIYVAGLPILAEK